MRTLFILFLIVFSATAKSQAYMPLSFMNFSQRAAFAGHHAKDSAFNKKWFLTSYAGAQTSFSFFKGGHATVFAVPVTLQLNRKLNENFYAFASASAAPAYINFNNSFLSTNINKLNQNTGLYRANNFGVSSRVDIGLTYVNDDKTFSISGSIGVERNSYPIMPYYQTTAPVKNSGFSPNR